VLEEIDEIVFIEDDMFFIFRANRLVCKRVAADRAFVALINYRLADVAFFHLMILLLGVGIIIGFEWVLNL
jgi:hypothetical protein